MSPCAKEPEYRGGVFRDWRLWTLGVALVVVLALSLLIEPLGRLLAWR